VYYTSFPIQEQGKQGDWNYKVSPVYAVGILDFVFDDHKHESTILHTVELKNQWCEVSYDKLKFLYLELPKFTKGIDQLETHFDKWLFLLKHLPRLDDPPELLQNQIFIKLFEVAEISDFSWEERDAYENSLKYYRDLKNVLDTAKEEGIEEERARGLQRQKALLTRQLSRKLGDISPEQLDLINQLSSTSLEELAEIFLDFENRSVLEEWLSQQS
jgi:predicted transposase/invertase (TIGR01784 family)